MNRLSFVILSILHQNSAVSNVTAMTLKEIMESEDYGYKLNTVFKKIKEFEFKNLNPISKSNIDDTKKLLSDTYSIKEEKLWEDIFFIKGEKIK